MARIATERKEAFVMVVGVRIFSIDVVVVIGREHGILTGANRVMDRIISSRAAQTSKDVMRSAAAALVRVSAIQRLPNAACPRQEQAGEDGANKHSRESLHI
jgi:hypothetical protein